MKRIYFLLVICILASLVANAQDSVTVTFRLQCYLPFGQPLSNALNTNIRVYGNFGALNATNMDGDLLSNTMYPPVNLYANRVSNTSIPYLLEKKVRFPNSSIGQELLFCFHEVANDFAEDTVWYSNSPLIDCLRSPNDMYFYEPTYPVPFINVLRPVIIPSSDITLQYCYASCYQCDGSLPEENSPSIFVTGKTYADLNQDELLNPSEIGITNAHVQLISATDTIDSYSGFNGSFGFFVNPGTYSIHFEVPDNYTTPFVDQTIVIDSAGEQNTMNIPLNLNPTFFDLHPVFNPGTMVAGFEQNSLVQILNDGNAVSNVSCSITLPAGVSFVSSIPAPSTINGTTYTFLINTIAALSHENILISTALAPPPTLMPGDNLFWTINASPVPNELNTANNTRALNTPVMSSYDPNDKLMLKGNQLTPSQVNTGEAFQYRIRFQNTGNYPASFIHVRDTLVAGLNPASIKILSSSHDCSLQINNERALDFYFPNIQLPDSTSDPEGSQGYVIFEVQPFLPVEEGDEIENTAHIYFDFNPAVITNTNRVRIETPEGLLKWNTSAPNTPWFDANGSIRWIQGNWKNLAVYSIDGRLIHSETLQGNSSSFQLKNAGMYVLQFSNANQTRYFKVMR